MLPTDAATTLPNPPFTGGITRRPLLPTHHVSQSERRRCLACHKSSTCDHSVDEPGRSVDEFGYHITGCKRMLPLRTKLWHDPLVQMWHQLANISGQSCGSEVTNLMVNLNKRRRGPLQGPVQRPHRRANHRRWRPALLLRRGFEPGYVASWGAVQKDAAWLAQARSQGDTFRALCHEAGGRAGRGCEVFLTSSAPSLPRRKASAWLSGSMLFSDCMRPHSEEWPCSSTPAR